MPDTSYHCGYTAEDFRNGDFDDTDPYTPLSRRQAKHILQIVYGEAPEAEIDEMVERSVEETIERIEDVDGDAPEEYERRQLTFDELEALDQVTGADPDTYRLKRFELTEEEKQALDEAYGVEPNT